MHQRRGRRIGSIWGAFLPLLAIGCGGEDAPVPACTELAGQCVGVPVDPVCDSEICTAAVTCSGQVEVATDAELAAAAQTATAGTCIALAPGAYGAVALPGGVSLLGRSADEVALHEVVLGAGDDATVRGLQIGAGGLRLDGARGVRVEAVRMAGSAEGMRLSAGSSASVVRSEIRDAVGAGLIAIDPEQLTVARTIISGSGHTGLWAQCSTGCDCAVKPEVALDHVLLERNGVLSAGLVATRANLRRVHIFDSHQDNYMGGDGLWVGECTDIDVAGLRVERSESVGILMGNASGMLGAPGDDQGIIIVDSRPGLWLVGIGAGADPTQTVTIQNAEVTGSLGMGIGIAGESQGIIIVDSKVANTARETMPVRNGADEVGDAMVWLDGSAAMLQGVTLSGSGRASLLIDGPVGPGSQLQDITLADGDEQAGIVQQMVTGTDLAPTVDANTPAVQRHDSLLFDVPLSPATPSAI